MVATPAGPDTGWRHGPWPAVLAAVALAALLFAVNLAGDYVYDDRLIAREDPRVHVPGEWTGFFRQPYFPYAADPLWRPLPSLSFALHWRIHGELAWPPHLVNILLHAAVSGLVAVLAWRLTRSLRVTWLAGLLFAAHPVHVEAVAYLVGRAETLCALGVLGGLVLFSMRPLTYPRVLGIVACFVLALASKEHGLLLAPMLGAWYGAEWLLRRRKTSLPPQVPPWRAGPIKLDYYAEPPRSSEGVRLTVLFFLMSITILLYIYVRETIAPLYWEIFFLRWTVNPLARAEGLDRLLVPFTILGRYAQLLIWPARLSPDYGANIIDYRINWSDPYLYLGMATAAAWIAGAVYTWLRRRVVVLLLLLWAAIAYFLISNTFYLIGISMGERLIYLTSIFVIVLMAMALARLPRRTLVAAAVVLVALGSLRSVSYAWQWNDELRLYSYARQRHPDSIQLHFLEAYVWYERGELEKAEGILSHARQIGPEAQQVWALSALVAELRGEPEQAERFGVIALDLDINPPHMRHRE